MQFECDCRSPQTMIGRILDGIEYFDPEVIPAVWRPGNGKLVVVVGDNAGGKSVFRRIVAQVCRGNGVECMDPSMQGRADGHNALRSMVYGSEVDQSTGENSAHTVIAGVHTCRGRDRDHVIFWDEPDLGLGDSWSAGMGQYIREFSETAPDFTRGIFLVTHSRPLLRELLPVEPTYVHLGRVDAPASLQEWLDQPVVPLDITKLKEISNERWRKISAIKRKRMNDANHK